MTVQTNVNRVSTADPEPEMGRMLWRLAPMIYGPTVLFALGEGAVVPLLPVIAAELGADVPTAALVAAALVVGQLCGNIPAGWAVARVGERVTMAGGPSTPGRSATVARSSNSGQSSGTTTRNGSS